MIKLVSQEWSFGCLGIKSLENSYLPRVQTGPLYRDPWNGYLSKQPPQDLWKPTGSELTSSTAIKIVTANESLLEGFVAIVTDLVNAIDT